jgi:succinoglycan biosynthesis protein ExoL
MTAKPGNGPGLKPHLAYFVHDLADTAVARRVRMLHAGGMTVTVLGFRRTVAPIHSIDGAATVDLGLTRDGRLLQRTWAVIRTLLASGRVRAAIRTADVVMARNLETLILAERARGQRRLVYECLDIHRTLVGTNLLPRLIQGVERRAMRGVDLILTSSPRFRDDYFYARYGHAVPVLLIENKLLTLGLPSGSETISKVPPGPPWVIGWFGMLRCARSFEMLSEIARTSEGRIEVLIAGIPSDDVFTGFGERVAASPYMRYVGPYKSNKLGELYAQVHFSWAIDYFEEGLNSVWLMPNRVYEAAAFGVVPLALAAVETGRWLDRNGVGIVVDDARTDVPAVLDGLTPAHYDTYASAVIALPPNLSRAGMSDCQHLVEAILSEYSRE